MAAVRLVPRPRVLFRVASVCLVAWLGAATGIAAVMPERAQGRAIGIRELQVSHDGAATVVTISATGPLTSPTVGQVDDPPRLFLDFPDVLPATGPVPGMGSTPVRRVRIALHSASPRVTRVVVDLVRHEPFRVEQDDQDPSRFRIHIGVIAEPVWVRHEGTVPQPAAAALPPVAQLPPAAAPIGTSLARPPATEGTPPSTPQTAAQFTKPSLPSASPPSRSAVSPGSQLPAREVEAFREQVRDATGRLALVRPLLVAIDSHAAAPADSLQMAVEEFDSIRRLLSTIRPAEALRPTHDLLVRACTFGSMAAGLRLEASGSADAAVFRNAAAAAAGALLLLDRACDDIGCTEPRGR